MLCADADHFRSLLYQAQAELAELRRELWRAAGRPDGVGMDVELIAAVADWRQSSLSRGDDLERLRGELRQADTFGRGEFRVTQWAYDQAVRVMNERGDAIKRARELCEHDVSRIEAADLARIVLRALNGPTAE